MANDTIQEIENNIREAKALKEMGDALGRLQENRDFKKIIREGYFEKEAIRLVHLKSDPSMQSPASQQSIVDQIDAIGALSQYFRTVFHTAALATKAIYADEQEIEALLEEEKLNG